MARRRPSGQDVEDVGPCLSNYDDRRPVQMLKLISEGELFKECVCGTGQDNSSLCGWWLPPSDSLIPSPSAKGQRRPKHDPRAFDRLTERSPGIEFQFHHLEDGSQYAAQYRYLHTVGRVCRHTVDPLPLGCQPDTSPPPTAAPSTTRRRRPEEVNIPDGKRDENRKERAIKQVRISPPDSARACRRKSPRARTSGRREPRRVFLSWEEYRRLMGGGHPSGDPVMQQVAAVVTQVLASMTPGMLGQNDVTPRGKKTSVPLRRCASPRPSPRAKATPRKGRPLLTGSAKQAVSSETALRELKRLTKSVAASEQRTRKVAEVRVFEARQNQGQYPRVMLTSSADEKEDSLRSENPGKVPSQKPGAHTSPTGQSLRPEAEKKSAIPVLKSMSSNRDPTWMYVRDKLIKSNAADKSDGSQESATPRTKTAAGSTPTAMGDAPSPAPMQSTLQGEGTRYRVIREETPSKAFEETREEDRNLTQRARKRRPPTPYHRKTSTESDESTETGGGTEEWESSMCPPDPPPPSPRSELVPSESSPFLESHPGDSGRHQTSSDPFPQERHGATQEFSLSSSDAPPEHHRGFSALSIGTLPSDGTPRASASGEGQQESTSSIDTQTFEWDVAEVRRHVVIPHAQDSDTTRSGRDRGSRPTTSDSSSWLGRGEVKAGGGRDGGGLTSRPKVTLTSRCQQLATSILRRNMLDSSRSGSRCCTRASLESQSGSTGYARSSPRSTPTVFPAGNVGSIHRTKDPALRLNLSSLRHGSISDAGSAGSQTPRSPSSMKSKVSRSSQTAGSQGSGRATGVRTPRSVWTDDTWTPRSCSSFTSLTPRTDVGSLTPRTDVSSVTPRSNVGSVTPRADIGSVTPRSNVGSVTPRADVGSVTPRSNVTDVTPRSNVSNATSRSYVSNVSPRSNLTSRSNVSSLSSRSNVTNMTSRSNMSTLTSRSNASAATAPTGGANATKTRSQTRGDVRNDVSKRTSHGHTGGGSSRQGKGGAVSVKRASGAKSKSGIPISVTVRKEASASSDKAYSTRASAGSDVGSSLQALSEPEEDYSRASSVRSATTWGQPATPSAKGLNGVNGSAIRYITDRRLGSCLTLEGSKIDLKTYADTIRERRVKEQEDKQEVIVLDDMDGILAPQSSPIAPMSRRQETRESSSDMDQISNYPCLEDYPYYTESFAHLTEAPPETEAAVREKKPARVHFKSPVQMPSHVDAPSAKPQQRSSDNVAGSLPRSNSSGTVPLTTPASTSGKPKQKRVSVVNIRALQRKQLSCSDAKPGSKGDHSKKALGQCKDDISRVCSLDTPTSSSETREAATLYRFLKERHQRLYRTKTTLN